MKKFPCCTSGEKGIALVEMTIVLPLLLLMMAVIVDVGRLFYESALLQGRLNAAARYLAMNTPAGDCVYRDQDDLNYCDVAESLVLYASPDESGTRLERCSDVQSQVYQANLSHWQVSATYSPEFIFSSLLPESVNDLAITLSAIQHSVFGEDGS